MRQCRGSASSGTVRRTSVPPSRGRRNSSVPPTQLGALAHGHQAEPAPRACRRSRPLPWSSTSSSSASGVEAQPDPGARRRRSAARRCSAPPAARGRRGCRSCASTGTAVPVRSYATCDARAASRRSTDTSRSCSRARAPRGSTGAASATGRGRCRAPSARSRRSRAGRRAAASPRAPACSARPSIEPIAVRIWPNSSCSSRDDLAQRRLARGDQLCASSRRSSDSVASSREQPPVRANQVQAGRDDRRQRRGQEPVDLPLHLAVDVLDLLRRLLFALVVLHEQPRDGGAERRLPRLQRQLDLRARLVLLPVAGQLEDAVRRRPRTARASWPGTRAAPASAARPPPPPAASAHRPDRGGCARTARTRRSADSGSVASSMSRIASPSWFRSF